MLSFLILSLLSAFTVGHCKVFTASISTAGHYELGQDVTCKVTITNTADTDHYLLKRGTPLDSVKANIFSISQGSGGSVEFDGLLYQRIEPTEEEYVLVAAHSSVSSTVDLSHSYKFNIKASFEARLESLLVYYQHSILNSSHQYVVSNTEHFKMVGNEASSRPTEAEVIRRNSSMMKLIDLDTDSTAFEKVGAYVAPSFAGTPYGSDIQTTQSVYAAVYNVLPSCYNAVGSNVNLYSNWFGIRYSGYMDIVRGAFLNIKSAMERYQYTMYFDGPECVKIQNVIAYTYKGSTVIYLCSLYRGEPATKGINTKMGTVLHEFTHAVAYTDDITYGQSNCAALAKNQPNSAIKNADNYRCFSEPLAQ